MLASDANWCKAGSRLEPFTSLHLLSSATSKLLPWALHKLPEAVSCKKVFIDDMLWRYLDAEQLQAWCWRLLAADSLGARSTQGGAGVTVQAEIHS